MILIIYQQESKPRVWTLLPGYIVLMTRTSDAVSIELLIIEFQESLHNFLGRHSCVLMDILRQRILQAETSGLHEERVHNIRCGLSQLPHRQPFDVATPRLVRQPSRFLHRGEGRCNTFSARVLYGAESVRRRYQPIRTTRGRGLWRLGRFDPFRTL